MNILQKLNNHLHWFWMGNQETKINKGKKIVSKEIKRLFGSCPVCQNDLQNHRVTSFAQVIFTEENKTKIERFLNTLRQNNWQEAIKFSEFDGLRDSLSANHLKCLNGTSFWFVLVLPFALYDKIEILEWNKIDYESSVKLEELTNSYDYFVIE